jgi:hypothetical protein
MKRRSFIEFIGKGTLAVPLLQLGLSGCSSDIEEGIVANNLDELVLIIQLSYHKQMMKHYYG